MQTCKELCEKLFLKSEDFWKTFVTISLTADAHIQAKRINGSNKTLFSNTHKKNGENIVNINPAFNIHSAKFKYLNTVQTAK